MPLAKVLTLISSLYESNRNIFPFLSALLQSYLTGPSIWSDLTTAPGLYGGWRLMLVYSLTITRRTKGNTQAGSRELRGILCCKRAAIRAASAR